MLQGQGLVFWNMDEVRNQWLHLGHYAPKGRLFSIWRQRVKTLTELTLALSRSSKGSAVDFREAESTGLEPATSAVTGQRSNQLSYDSNLRNAKLEPNAIPFNQKMIWESAGSWTAQSCIRNSTAFSICGSFPSAVLLASLSTLMSGST